MNWTITAVASCVAALSATGVTAQNAPAATPLTLEQALALAVMRSEGVGIAQAGVTRAAAEQVRARSGGLPQLNASASYERALASEFAGLFTSTRTDPLDGATTIDTSALPFGRKNTWRINLSFSQNLFSGGRLKALSDLAAAGRESADIDLTTARASVLFDVTQAYYDAALSARMVSIAEATVRQAEDTVTIVQAGYSAGTQPEFELLRARVARDNQTPTLIRQRANRDIALLRLKQLLDLPPDADIELADSLQSSTLPPSPAFATRVAAVESTLHAESSTVAIPDAPLPDRAVVRSASTGVRQGEASLRAARAERMPSASLTSTYGRVAYPSDLVPVVGDFRTNWTVGATLQVPILTGGRVRAGERVAAADLEQSRLRLQQVQELAALDSRSAMAQLIATRAAWEASLGTVQQAARAYEIAEVRYRAGVSTQLELTDSRLLSQQAELNRAQAARDLQVARARIALLPDLPLSNGQTPTTTPQLPQQVPVTPATPDTTPGTRTPGTVTTTQASAFSTGAR
jgi:outer membrane protein TolC